MPRPPALLVVLALLALTLGSCSPEPGAPADAARGASVEVEVESLAVDGSGIPLLLLREKGGQLRRLPISIGEGQARSIHGALRGIASTRPNTHDLMVSMLGRLRARIERVVVTDFRGDTYYAVIEITGARDLDARPSDAIALAVRTATPIFVLESVLAGAVPSAPLPDDEGRAIDDPVEVPEDLPRAHQRSA
jgi:bifunctional DNase/RNase